MSKSQLEQQLEDEPKVAVRLKNVASYQCLEEDEVKHDGDVVHVLEGRAVALVQQGVAEPADARKPNRK
jgi:hypothetical protein